MKNSLKYCFICLVGFFIGYSLSGSGSFFAANFSSLESTSLNSYENLPCATPQEFAKLSAAIKLKGEIPGDYCDGSYKAKMGKLLLMASNLTVNLDGTWPEELRNAITRPLDFIGHSADSIHFDSTQTLSVAKNMEGTIFLGSAFFEGPPFYALSALIHESRHSNQLAPAHAVCRYGDIPKAVNGCDERLSIEDDAGAYSFEALFLLSLSAYAEDLIPGDREYLLNSALHMIATRFNIVPETMALPIDTLIALADSGQVLQIHPFSHELFEIPIELSLNQKIDKLSFSAISQGVFLLSNLGKIYIWTPKKKFKPFMPDVIPDDFQAIDINRFIRSETTFPHSRRVPIEFPHNTIIDEKHFLYFIGMDPLTSSLSLRLADHQPIEDQIRVVHTLIANGAVKPIGLIFSDSGRIHQVAPLRSKSKKFYFPEVENLNLVNGAWASVDSGIVYDTFFGATTNGELYQFENSELVRVKEFNGISIKKYFETTNFVVAQTYKNSFYTMRFADSIPYEVKLPERIHLRVSDLAQARIFYQPGSSGNANVEGFYKTCFIKIPIEDPWMAKGMGIDRDSNLVVAGANNDCRILVKKVRSARINQLAPNEENLYFSQVFLEIAHLDGGVTRLLPYGPMQ